MKKASKKKILFYNWIQFDEPDNIGGGVNIYQKNLINELSKDNKYEIYFLSSGTRYDLFSKKIYIEKTKNVFGDRCRSYRIVNSPCTAPMSTMYKDLDKFENDESLYAVFEDFIKKEGGFDVIHFNNIEGLSSKCLEIKKDFPQTKTIFSIHNYLLFTPEANMFYLSKDKSKTEVKKKVSQKSAIKFYKLDTKLRNLGLSSLGAKILTKVKSLISKNNTGEESEFINNSDLEKYRKINTERVNKYIDSILAVSDRTKEIAIENGIDKTKITTEYIGTAVAEKAKNKLHKTSKHEGFTVAYMGYFDRAKGFDFLIESLEKIPNELAKKINFVCYAKIKKDSDKSYVDRINNLKDKFKNAEYHNGYTHDQFDSIMSSIDLGIVPVIWEDNLPQVAIEYAAYGVPVLTSSLGGAHELSSEQSFVFEANNTTDFYTKLEKIIEKPSLQKMYFDKSIKLTTNSEHVQNLRKYYEQ